MISPRQFFVGRTIVLFIILIVAGVGWAAFQFFGTPEDEDTGEQHSWPKYSSSTGRFEIRYPNTWNVWGGIDESGGVQFGHEGMLTTNGEETTVRAVGMSIRNYEDRDELRILAGFARPVQLELEGFDEWIRENIGELEGEERVEQIQFGQGNYEGMLVETYKEVGVTELVPRVYVEMEDGRILEFEGFVPSLTTEEAEFKNEYNYRRVFDQMLSTFGFRAQ